LYTNGSTSGNNIYDEYLLTNGNLERIGSTNIDLSQYATSASMAALDTRVGSLETSVSNLQTTVNNLSALTSDYVLVSTFNAVVGDISTVNGVYNDLNSDDSITETLIDIYDRLTWQEMN
jgi:di/tripeptidase